MSRLDYITIAIVAACILAIIFLAYKMTDLFNEKPNTDDTELTTDLVEEEVDDGTYNYETDEEGEPEDLSTEDTDNATIVPANNETDNEPSTTTSTPTTTYEEEEEDKPISSGGSSLSSQGKFMVIAGTFTSKANAKNQASKLRDLGFTNAKVEIFDKGKYAIVLVDRFSDMASAERLVKDLTTEGVKSYVKAKEVQ